MKYGLLIFGISLLWSLDSKACDACGCSLMGNRTPLLSASNKSYLTVGWQSSGFKSIAEQSIGSIDQFRVLDISSQYYFNDKLSVMASVPYKFNSRNLNNVRREVNGLGDIRFHAAYSFLQKQIEDKKPGLFLQGNAGISIPTGEYDPHIHDSDLPENFNPGNGSLGFSAGLTFTVTKPAGGIEFDNNSTYYLPSTAGYQFGGQYSSRLTFYGNVHVRQKLIWLPFVGLEYQHVSKDQYANGITVEETGGNNLLGTIGTQIKTGPLLISGFINIPIIDQYANQTVELQQQFRLSATYIF